MLWAKHLSLKEEGDAAGEAPQSQKRREMLRLKHLSLKRKGWRWGWSTSVSKEEGDAEGEAPQSKKKRVMLRAGTSV